MNQNSIILSSNKKYFYYCDLLEAYKTINHENKEIKELIIQVVSLKFTKPKKPIEVFLNVKTETQNIITNYDISMESPYNITNDGYLQYSYILNNAYIQLKVESIDKIIIKFRQPANENNLDYVTIPNINKKKQHQTYIEGLQIYNSLVFENSKLNKSSLSFKLTKPMYALDFNDYDFNKLTKEDFKEFKCSGDWEFALYDEDNEKILIQDFYIEFLIK